MKLEYTTMPFLFVSLFLPPLSARSTYNRLVGVSLSLALSGFFPLPLNFPLLPQRLLLHATEKQHLLPTLLFAPGGLHAPSARLQDH